jgi:hypothetical protein
MQVGGNDTPSALQVACVSWQHLDGSGMHHADVARQGSKGSDSHKLQQPLMHLPLAGCLNTTSSPG